VETVTVHERSGVPLKQRKPQPSSQRIKRGGQTSRSGPIKVGVSKSVRNVLKELAMPEMSKVELLVLGYIANAKPKIHVNDLFKLIRMKFVPFTDTEIVSAIWSLKDRRKIDVNAAGDLQVTDRAAATSREVATV
jgi:hypothetical protein